MNNTYIQEHLQNIVSEKTETVYLPANKGCVVDCSPALSDKHLKSVKFTWVDSELDYLPYETTIDLFIGQQLIYYGKKTADLITCGIVLPHAVYLQLFARNSGNTESTAFLKMDICSVTFDPAWETQTFSEPFLIDIFDNTLTYMAGMVGVSHRVNLISDCSKLKPAKVGYQDELIYTPFGKIATASSGNGLRQLVKHSYRDTLYSVTKHTLENTGFITQSIDGDFSVHFELARIGDLANNFQVISKFTPTGYSIENKGNTEYKDLELFKGIDGKFINLVGNPRQQIVITCTFKGPSIQELLNTVLELDYIYLHTPARKQASTGPTTATVDYIKTANANVKVEPAPFLQHPFDVIV